jgi:hypothetical protein
VVEGDDFISVEKKRGRVREMMALLLQNKKGESRG